MRILFLPLITRGPAIGTITRCLAIADHLRMLGHEAFFLTNGEGAKNVAEAGFPFMEGVIPDPPRNHHPLRDLSDVAIHLNLTKEDYLRHSLAAERSAIDRFRPDVLFSEFKLTAPITAATSLLPLVSTACSPADPRFRSPLYPEQSLPAHEEAVVGFNRILEEKSLEPIADVSELFFGRSRVKIAPTTPELEPLLADVPDLHYVGYLLYDRWELAPLPDGLLQECLGRNVVFAYFSSGEIGPREYTKVLPEAYDSTEFHAIVAVGDHPQLPELPPPTSNTTWVRFVPGRSIMARSRALVFHGGQNTAMASLIHGLPSLVFPGSDFERDFNASALDSVGAGIKLSSERFNPEDVLDATRKLREPAHRLAAEEYSRKVIRGGGARRAADLVLEVANGSEPV
jgi:UDP:flavonoid glycosyltransferase YjiC (YdhE family)